MGDSPRKDGAVQVSLPGTDDDGMMPLSFQISTIPPKPRFHEMRPAPTRAGAAFTKALPYKSKTRRARGTPTRQPPIVSVPLVAS